MANYFGWRLALHFSDYTSALYTRLYFEFQRVTEGLRVQEQTWEFCYSLLETYYPSVVGRLYIDNYFDSATVEQVELLIELIKEQVDHQLTGQTWMDQKTKQQAKQKVGLHAPSNLHRLITISTKKNPRQLHKLPQGTTSAALSIPSLLQSNGCAAL